MAAKILVVEDENIVAKDIQRTLQNVGYEVPAVVATGEAAVEKVQELGPDLVLMDIMLRGPMDGITAAEVIRDRWNVPTIYLTAHADTATLERAKISEPFGYVLKPFEERDLHTTVEMALYKHQMDRKLRENERWLSVTLSSIGDGVIATDVEGRVAFINPVAQSLTGWNSDEAIGRPLAEVFQIVNEYTRKPVENPVAKVLATGRIVGLANHTLLIARDGTERPIDDSGAPIQVPGGGVLGAVLVFRDITDKRRLEYELQRRAEALALADRRKDDFLAVLGHELRNPLAAIQNGTEVLKQLGLPNDDAIEVHSLIQRQLTHMRLLIDDLLDVTRITRGKIVLKRECLDLVQHLQQVAEEHRQAIEAQGSVLKLDMPAEPIWCEADPTRIAQIMSNLLTNAAKFMDKPGEVTVCVRRDAERQVAVATIRDTGVGMDREMLDHLFEPFMQADRSLDRSQGGLGLGLSLVKSLVELHGGCVGAQSAGPGQGSEFTFEIPALAGQASIAAQGVPLATPAVPRRVLLIDDHRQATILIRKILEAAGHDVQVAHDGPSGVALAMTFCPEVILCDIGLPGSMSGYDVAAAIRSEPSMQAVYLVALSGYGEEKDRQQAQAAGFDYHVTKPAARSTLDELLQSFPRF